MKYAWVSLITLAALVSTHAVAQTQPSGAQPAAASGPDAQTPSPAGAKVYIISPPNGARIRGPFVVQFGLRNMGVTQAGSSTPNAGHHHILVDAKERLVDDEPIPADRNHVHFGAGQTETRLDLPPGRHTLQLVLGDANHRNFKPAVASDVVQITVLSSVRPRPRSTSRTRRARYR